LSPSFTYASPSSSSVKTEGAIYSQSPSPVQRSWSIQTFIGMVRLLLVAMAFASPL